MTDKVSLTAQGIAIVRALESEKPEGDRLFYDPYAQHFVSRWLSSLTGLIVRLGYAERRGPGVTGFLKARTRYMDDYLLDRATDGILQLVILGAGYDARAYRFADQLAGKVGVFEVDHPATQQTKINKLKKVLGCLPEHVVFVPVDFNRESLRERLRAGGYNEYRKTLFIWEGVTMYLLPEAVDGTLAFIARHSGAGSSVVFDYIYSSVIEGTVKRGEAAGMRRYRRFTGEELVFGIEEGTAVQFLEQRGFCDIENVTGQDLEGKYFSAGPGEGQRVAPVYAIASGTVPGQPT